MAITRSKQGCFTCRSRRKKCDEKKPKCSGCVRNFLNCEWPCYPNQTLSQFRRDSSVNGSGIDFSIVIKEKKNCVDLTKESISYSKFLAGPFLSSLIPEPTRIKARKILFQQLQKSLPLQKVVECVDILSIYGRNAYQDQLYEETLIALKKEFDSSSKAGFEDWALNTINLLMIREFSLDIPRIAEIIKHLQASFHIIRTRLCSNHITFWLRLNSDTFVFYSGMATLCCSLSELQNLPSPYESEKIFEPLFKNPDCSHNFDSNPILSDAYESIVLNNQASYLLRSNVSNKFNLATDLLRKVDHLLLAPSNSIHHLMHNCTKIVLLKIIHPTLSVNDRDIQIVNDRLVQSIRTANISDVQMFGLWPVITCAACSISQQNRDFILSICEYSGIGGITFAKRQKFKSSLKKIWIEAKGLTVFDDIPFLNILLLNP